jgi:hypothetical protein
MDRHDPSAYTPPPAAAWTPGRTAVADRNALERGDDDGMAQRARAGSGPRRADAGLERRAPTPIIGVAARGVTRPAILR